MSKRSTQLSVASGPHKTAKARPKKSNSTPLDSAPLAVSRSRKQSVSYSQISINGRSALRVRTMIPLCEIGNDAFNNGLYFQGTAGAFTASTASLNPYSVPNAVFNATTPGFTLNGEWISPHLPLLALAFDRYRMQSLEFCYEPQSAATVADRLVFAWTDDPSHPFLAPSILTAAVVPTQLQLLVTEDSVAFMPWKSWSIKVPVARDDRFMYDDSSEEDLSGSNRFCDFGALSCVGSASPTIPIQYGILYVALSIDLYDPVPIVSSVSLLVSSLHALRRHQKKKPLSLQRLAPTFATLLSTHPTESATTPADSKEEKKDKPVSRSDFSDSRFALRTREPEDSEYEMTYPPSHPSLVRQSGHYSTPPTPLPVRSAVASAVAGPLGVRS